MRGLVFLAGGVGGIVFRTTFGGLKDELTEYSEKEQANRVWRALPA